MRSLLVLVGLVSLSPTALASAGPMDEKQMQELATLIAHGVITDVVCQGEPEFDGVKTYTPYWATLTIDAVEKGEDLTSVTLPFSTQVFEPDAALPKCDWLPYYEVGYKGLFYLMSGADEGLFTLVGDGAFVPDADSLGEPLPSCQATEADAVAFIDASPSDADSSEVGPVSEDAETWEGGREGDTAQLPDEDDGGAPAAPGARAPCQMTGCPAGSMCASSGFCESCQGPCPGDEADTTTEADAGGAPAESPGDEGAESGGCAGSGPPLRAPLALLMVGLVVTALRRR